MKNFYQCREFVYSLSPSKRTNLFKVKLTDFQKEVIVIQHNQNKEGLPINPIFIDGLTLYDIKENNHPYFLSVLFKKLLTIKFVPYSFIQIRNSICLKKYDHILERYGYVFSNHLNIYIQTFSLKKVWNNLHKNRKKQIIKSLEKGVIIKEADTEIEVAQLYSILLELYRNKIKQQIYELEVFINFFHSSSFNKRGKIFLVKYNDEVIGGSVCPIDPNHKIYEWFICGLDHKYKSIYPSVMATWAPILYACNNKIPIFDFMGAGKPEVPYGVRNFKKKFGGTFVNVGRYTYFSK